MDTRVSCLPQTGWQIPSPRVFEARPALPIQEHFGQCRIERHSCIGVFGFDIAYNARDDASPHEECKVILEHVAPLESEELAAAEPGSEIKDNHRAEGLRNCDAKPLNLDKDRVIAANDILGGGIFISAALGLSPRPYCRRHSVLPASRGDCT